MCVTQCEPLKKAPLRKLLVQSIRSISAGDYKIRSEFWENHRFLEEEESKERKPIVLLNIYDAFRKQNCHLNRGECTKCEPGARDEYLRSLSNFFSFIFLAQDCKSFRIGSSCCEFICLDETEGPDGDTSVDVTWGEGGWIGGDLGLRLIATAVTAVLSLALLAFLFYRLKRRRGTRNSGTLTNTLPLLS